MLLGGPEGLDCQLSIVMCDRLEIYELQIALARKKEADTFTVS
jgi:hypothetical protein